MIPLLSFSYSLTNLQCSYCLTAYCIVIILTIVNDSIVNNRYLCSMKSIMYVPVEVCRSWCSARAPPLQRFRQLGFVHAHVMS